MTRGYTLKLYDWNGEVGKCENDHVVKLQENGYGFCVECAENTEGYSTLYVAENYTMPGGEDQ